MYSIALSYACVPNAGGTLTAVYTYTSNGGPIATPMQYYLELAGSSGASGVRMPISSNGDSADFPGLSDDIYTVRLLDSAEALLLESNQLAVNCGSTGGGGVATCDLLISNVVLTQPTTVGGTGGMSASISTRYPPLTMSVTRLAPLPEITSPLANTQPGALVLSAVPIGQFRLNVKDAQNCEASHEYAIAAPPPIIGCMDEAASNFDSLATQADNTLCVYTPRWVGAWHPEGVPVYYRPPAVPSVAYVAGDLYAGFPVGHSLAGVRPLAYVATIKATVGLSGLATFNLAPYLRSELGALLSDGSRRLDLNSLTAQTEDLYVGFRLEVGGRGVAQGYAVNSVLSEIELEQLRTEQDPLWPFGKTLPRWPGFDYQVSCLVNDTSGRLGKVVTVLSEADPDNDWREVHLSCPTNALPVAWLSPEGGFGYWVFRGNHAYGDEVGEGAPYIEAKTNELRYSSRGPSRETIEASTGVYSDRDLVEGLRTLRRGVQAWYQPDGPGSAWRPVFLKGGAFPAYREGRRRYEATVQFTEAAPQYVQGQ